MVERRVNLAKLEKVYTGDRPDGEIADRVGLSLSGGGYKACIFHLGSLERVNQMGLLGRIQHVSSVSGGSIASAWLALHWKGLSFDSTSGVASNFHEKIVVPLWRFALTAKIDARAVIFGVLDPVRRTGRYLEGAYNKLLYRDARFLEFVQEPDGPRFTLNATSYELNSLWRFTKGVARNHRVGEANIGDVPVARLVAASSAFPPILSPVVLDFPKGSIQPFPDANVPADYAHRALLVDAGVYDNMGLETVWKSCRTILVCNAGDPFADDPSPATNWLSQTRRTISMIHRQAENNRLRWLLAMDKAGERVVSYWGVRGRAGDYPAPGAALTNKQAKEAALAPVRLWPLKLRKAQLLFAHGYSLADSALRAFWPDAAAATAATDLPFLDENGRLTGVLAT